MHSGASSMLLVAPVPRTARSRIPVLGRAIDERVEAAFQAAFDRAEGAILETAERNGETVDYTYSFQRWQRATLRAHAPASGTSLLPAIAAAGVGYALEAGWTGSTYLAGARIAAICSRSIVVATPDRRGVAIRRVPLEAVRTIVRNNGSVVIGLVDEQFVLEGLTDPKRFAKDALRCVGNAMPDLGVVSSAAVKAAADRDAVEAADIRRRLRDRGWKLALASDDIVRGEWQVLYVFSHPDGLDAHGEGGSDLQALRAAEADAAAKERSLDEDMGASA